jgi:hypothetical protein
MSLTAHFLLAISSRSVTANPIAAVPAFMARTPRDHILSEMQIVPVAAARFSIP